MIITIDGPCASGKSCVAQLIAKKLSITHLNSGLLYRALAYILITFFEFKQDNLVSVSKNDLDRIIKQGLDYLFEDGNSKIIYDNQDITSFLKSKKIDQAASILSTVPFIRDFLLEYQREFAKKNSIIVDGRDSGSVVFPNADFKFFLTATPEVRAERWRCAQLEKGINFNTDQALEEILIRDERDINRKVAPLIVPDGAFYLDNSELNLQETVDKILKQIVK